MPMSECSSRCSCINRRRRGSRASPSRSSDVCTAPRPRGGPASASSALNQSRESRSPVPSPSTPSEQHRREPTHPATATCDLETTSRSRPQPSSALLSLRSPFLRVPGACIGWRGVAWRPPDRQKPIQRNVRTATGRPASFRLKVVLACAPGGELSCDSPSPGERGRKRVHR